MEKITVLKVTSKTTKQDKPYKMLEVECAGEVRKVNLWSNFPNFANISEGSVIMGKMTMEGQYWNLSYEGQDKPRGGASGAYKEKVIGEAMQRKEASIGKFQDNKDWSIKVSSTMRDAVQLALAEIKDIRTLNTLEADILKWREWLWRNWDVAETQYPPF